jgi:hypothetical protein
MPFGGNILQLEEFWFHFLVLWMTPTTENPIKIQTSTLGFSILFHKVDVRKL